MLISLALSSRDLQSKICRLWLGFGMAIRVARFARLAGKTISVKSGTLSRGIDLPQRRAKIPKLVKESAVERAHPTLHTVCPATQYREAPLPTHRRSIRERSREHASGFDPLTGSPVFAPPPPGILANPSALTMSQPRTHTRGRQWQFLISPRKRSPFSRSRLIIIFFFLCVINRETRARARRSEQKNRTKRDRVSSTARWKIARVKSSLRHGGICSCCDCVTIVSRCKDVHGFDAHSKGFNGHFPARKAEKSENADTEITNLHSSRTRATCNVDVTSH